jgi:hypothetical protein
MSSLQPHKSKIDDVLDVFFSFHRHRVNTLLQWIYIPCILFGLLGVVWAIPFPYVSFLGKYNGFVNWASFLIAFSIYYYYKTSPVLSYAILLFVFAFSALIVTFEKLNRLHNWPHAGILCLLVLAFGLVLQIIGYSKEERRPGPMRYLKLLLNSPLWLAYRIFNSAGLNIK